MLTLFAYAGCGDNEPSSVSRAPPSEEEGTGLPESFPPVPPEMVYAPDERPTARETWDAPRTVAAFAFDRAWAGEEEVPARRIVYRVRLRVPRSLGEGHPAVRQPAAELHVDVSRDRLRARFVGVGWPVPEGSEIRIRADEPGAYVFDGRGGRPLGPGQMAQWFEGGRPKGAPSYRVEPPPTDEQSGPGELLCRFIAEWTAEGPSVVARRCGAGGASPSFRVGLWRAIRTADVRVTLPRRALRADHLDPPSPAVEGHAWQSFLTEASFEQLAPRRPLRPKRRGSSDEVTEDDPEHGLVVVNRGSTRIIVTVRGTPIGWVDAGVEAHFEVMRPGSYAIGALRPLGFLAAIRRPFTVPGRAVLPRWVPPESR